MAALTILAAVFGFLGVALGAFGAHALSARFREQPNLGDSYRTGAQYHLLHTLALLGTAWASSQWSSGLIPAAGGLFALGIVLFSGSLYVMALTGNRKLGAITPLGGLAFLAGWTCLALGVLTSA
jgi:uncharacterized membrane protein YgdD (TMEM256/DUF423 family)